MDKTVVFGITITTIVEDDAAISVAIDQHAVIATTDSIDVRRSAIDDSEPSDDITGATAPAACATSEFITRSTLVDY